MRAVHTEGKIENKYAHASLIYYKLYMKKKKKQAKGIEKKLGFSQT
jgi:hypothetical protein